MVQQEGGAHRVTVRWISPGFSKILFRLKKFGIDLVNQALFYFISCICKVSQNFPSFDETAQSLSRTGIDSRSSDRGAFSWVFCGTAVLWEELKGCCFKCVCPKVPEHKLHDCRNLICFYSYPWSPALCLAQDKWKISSG